jgi:hypothetical protein
LSAAIPRVQASMQKSGRPDEFAKNSLKFRPEGSF